MTKKPDDWSILPDRVCTMGGYYDGDKHTRIVISDEYPYSFVDVMFKDGEPVIGTHGVTGETAAAVWAAVKAMKQKAEEKG